MSGSPATSAPPGGATLGAPVGAAPVQATEVELFSLAGHDGHLREVYKAFARLLCRSPEQVHGRSLLELVRPEDVPAVVAGLAALERGAPEVLLESRFLQSDGAATHLQWVARTLPGTGLWWAAGRDITEFHRLLADRLALRTRLDLALGQATAALWDLDATSGFLSWEPQANEVLGVDDGAAPASVGELSEIVHPQDSKLVVAAMGQLMDTGVTEVGVRLGQDATLRYLSLRGKVLDRNRRGRPRRAVGLILDVTAEKAMEEQLLRMAMSDGPDRHPQPARLRPELTGRVAARHPRPAAAVGSHGRHRQLQDRQRHPRPSGRRRSAVRRRPGTEQSAAPSR